MSESSALPLLFTQLQARYPASGLLTELVQMTADRCIVRALVQLGNMTLATSMATAATVEQAEDQARLRVLALLGIHATLPHVSALTFPSYIPPAPPLALQDSSPTAATVPEVEPIALPFPLSTHSSEPATTSATTVVVPETATTVFERALEAFDAPPDHDAVPYDDASYDDAPYDDVSYNQATYEEEPFEVHKPLIEESSSEAPSSEAPFSDDRSSPGTSTATAEPPAKSKPRKPGADKPADDKLGNDKSGTDKSGVDKRSGSETDTASSSPSSDTASRDLSSLISQIGVEIERIGWSKRQGSTYLQKTYGKKTRSELTDDELEDFLTYLNTQPSATVAP